ncbi:roadblock/LC7 domain-containing protein [Caldimonas thermodepolymerans]|jgi:hypothetical protein|uniref:roadblock/LC7 domain-containing protein n=1 Tax=Caldimonas thermodepolymerans TaxID=215580 RepID=UPI00248FE9E9|nr:hypothetical protein [Caldimonas thermodepolymerans]
MLTSLFGDLGAPTNPRRGHDTPDFAATAILESSAAEVSDLGHIVDKHTSDLFVTGSPSEAIRQHLKATRADLETATRQITLFDPARMWAGSVIKALSDASGQPIERLHLRHQNTLATIALIERTALPRRVEDPLKIYHTDVREESPDAQAIPLALMESSHLTAVIVAPMPAAAVEQILATLHAATRGAHWRCPNLLFMLSTPVAQMAPRIAAMPWPPRLNVTVTTEPMTSASAVWNNILNVWNKVKTLPRWESVDGGPAGGAGEFPIKVADLDAPIAGKVAPRTAPASASPEPTVRIDTPRSTLDLTRMLRTLEQLTAVEGLLACCVIDASTGMVLGSRRSAEGEDIAIDLAAASHTEVLKAHRRAAREMGSGERIEEIIVTQGRRHHVLRTVTTHPELFLLAVLDKQHTNLALARFKVMEAEKALG